MEFDYSYVIVGTGLAGVSAAGAIRTHDTNGSILLVGKEEHLPYHRPHLSKGLWLGKTTFDEIFVHNQVYFSARRIDVRLNTTMTFIDTVARSMRDHRGNIFHYNKLLLATGGTPRRLQLPGRGADDVLYFRTVKDFIMLRNRMEYINHVVVIGGGFIGAEIAAAMNMNGKKVTMIFPEKAMMSRVFPPDLAEFVTKYYEEKGVTILNEDIPVEVIKNDKRFTVATKEGGMLSAESVIAGIGIYPETNHAQESGLKTENGIVVDEFFRTSDPNVFAAGDNTSFPSIALHKHVRIEHWDNSLSQGKYAGENMAGSPRAFEYIPYFYSDLFDLGFEAVGNVDSHLETFSDWREPFREGVIYYLEGGKVRGVLLWNVWEKLDAARELMTSQKTFTSKNLAGRI